MTVDARIDALETRYEKLQKQANMNSIAVIIIGISTVVLGVGMAVFSG